MQVITSITNQPRQTFNIKLDNNQVIIIRMYFYASQSAWYFDFEYNDYVSNGNKVVLSLNSIRHLRNILPFGIGFISETEADPFSLESFSSGSVIMTVLNQDDVNAIEDSIYNV